MSRIDSKALVNNIDTREKTMPEKRLSHKSQQQVSRQRHSSNSPPLTPMTSPAGNGARTAHTTKRRPLQRLARNELLVPGRLLSIMLA